MGIGGGPSTTVWSKTNGIGGGPSNSSYSVFGKTGIGGGSLTYYGNGGGFYKFSFIDPILLSIELLSLSSSSEP